MPCTPIVDLESHIITGPLAEQRLYEVPNAAMQVLQDLINVTWCEGKATKDEFSAKMALALGTFLDPANTPHVTAPTTVTAATVVEPDIIIPSQITPASILSSFTTEYGELMTEYAAKGTTFMSTYFPDDSALATNLASVLSGLRSITVSDITAGSVNPRSASAGSVTAGSVVAGSVAAPTVTEPSVYVPYELDMNALMDEYNSLYLELVALLEAKFTSYRTTYFANEGTVYASAEAWLLASLANVNAAIPPSVQAQILGNAQAQVLADKTRAQDAVVAQFAARGFPLPPGAAASAVIQIEQKAQDDIAATSRKIAELSVDGMQKMHERAMRLRETCMASANDFIKALASGPDMASKVLGIGYDIQTKLISSVSSLLSARAEVAKLSLAASTTNAQLTLDASKENAQLTLDASKQTVLLAFEAQKVTAQLGADADKTNVMIAFEAAKANQLSKLELLKHALNLSVDLRKTAISELVDWVRTMASATDSSERAVGSAYDANTRLIGAASQYLNSRTQVATMKNSVAQFNTQAALEAGIQNNNSDMKQVSNKLQVMLEDAKALVPIVASLFNNLHVSTTMTANGGSTLSQTGEY